MNIYTKSIFVLLAVMCFKSQAEVGPVIPRPKYEEMPRTRYEEINKTSPLRRRLIGQDKTSYTPQYLDDKYKSEGRYQYSGMFHAMEKTEWGMAKNKLMKLGREYKKEIRTALKANPELRQEFDAIKSNEDCRNFVHRLPEDTQARIHNILKMKQQKMKEILSYVQTALKDFSADVKTMAKTLQVNSVNKIGVLTK